MYEKNRHNEKAIYSVTAREKQNLAVPPERNTPSVPSITERSGCNPKPPTADTEAMLNAVAATFSKILPKLKKPIKPTKYDIEKICSFDTKMPHLKRAKWWREYFQKPRSKAIF